MGEVPIRVVTRARRNEVDGERDGRVPLRVTAAPVDGAANVALFRLIAGRTGVPVGRVSVARGETSRDKVVRVEGVDSSRLRAALLGDRPLRRSPEPVPSPPMSPSEKPQVEVPSDQPPPSRLEVEDNTVGDGDEALTGREVEVHYVGVSWATGRQFDASWDRGETFRFGLGQVQVIPGWDEGVAGMKDSGRRLVTIPPDLAYGKSGAGGVIGPDETLVFVVDLIGAR